ncbi:hypothetical protein PHYSODRAFT_318636 [Phytophthora sojae]|uniref:BZIP domain-containing protein n=1 Tax=Phytophthora sojae (strain P6497) TaxID=1094619 RepID=G5A5P5_PHYSP|nr:hypothetical protein PHYSODRAFT_318636 [Phytophthora sojae]EGZ08650.1 hypothetical protein PHYSODRAFT_318636 [Phytophthora sojae]|eukprot:XP_009535283.1 hypothetical protein PHYSODRAFT_318636 [Phytophthora sojae]
MNTSTLHPPNLRSFGDGVIRDVILRDRHYRRKRPPQDQIKTEPALNKTQKTRAALSTDELDEKFVAELELRRKRKRMHQARYKQKHRELLADLEKTIETLKTEVQELELQYRLVSYSVPTNSTIWGVAAEYFRLFRHGVKAPITALPRSSQYQVQCDFIQATMALDVTDGTVFGVKAVMKNLLLQSRCYQEIDTYPMRLEKGPGESLVATTRCVLKITDNTLRYGFPHLVGELAPLAGKLLGKRITLQGSVRFLRDNAKGRVTQLHWRVDMLSALLTLLGNLEDVERVFDGARVTPEGMHSVYYKL